jgi:hypothetical protein
MDINSNSGIDPKKLIEQDVFDAVGLEGLTDEQKQTLMLQMTESINNRVLIRIHDLLDEASKKEWEGLIDEGKNQEATDFLESKGISLDKLAVEESLGLKAQLIEMANQIKNK